MNFTKQSRRYKTRTLTKNSEIPSWGQSVFSRDFEYHLYPPNAHCVQFQSSKGLIICPLNSGDTLFKVDTSDVMFTSEERCSAIIVKPDTPVSIASRHKNIEYLIIGLPPALLADFEIENHSFIATQDNAFQRVSREIKYSLLVDVPPSLRFLDFLSYALVDRAVTYLKRIKNRATCKKETLSHASAELLISYIDNNLSETIQVNDLARYVKLSRSHFSRAFSNYFGISPQRLILKRRVNIARLLLTESSLSLTCIARKTGFSSLSHFSKAFKCEIGIPPKRYRETLERSN